MLWRNGRAVIVGSNQNTIEEIDVDYVEKHGIDVVRRMTGGGAVFHDLGNINYTIINKSTGDNFGGYEAFTTPVCNYLKTLGVNAEFSGRNDLVIDGKKFSGNAQAKKNGRIMHHGCILFDADFGDLSLSLRPKAEKVESKGVKSVRSRVTNVALHLENPMSSEEFLNGLGEYFRNSIEGISEYKLSPDDIAAVQKLADEKYSTWEWNFGHSPNYDWKNFKRFDFGSVDVRLAINQGIINKIAFFGDFFGVLDKSELEGILCGVRHEKQALRAALEGVDIGLYIHGMTVDHLVELLQP